MAKCTICNMEISRLCTLSVNTHICDECSVKISLNDYVLTNKIDNSMSNIHEITSLVSINSCESTENNITDEDLIIMDKQGKNIIISSDTELELDTKCICNTNDYKDALLASLYSQVEFLKTELDEINLLMRPLIIKESDVYTYSREASFSKGSGIYVSSNHSSGNNKGMITDENNENNENNNSSVFEPQDDNNDDININMDEYFKDLYEQYLRDREENISLQLNKVQEEQNNKYITENERKRIYKLDTSKQLEHELNTTDKWPPNTILIIGDSMINHLDEQRLSTSVKKTVKVRSFPGSTVEQMYKNVGPLLKKKPDVIFLHVGTNDAVKKTSDNIIDDILKLKHFIELQLPDTKIIISCPIMRTDDTKASLTIKHIISKMKFTMVDHLLNDNIF